MTFRELAELDWLDASVDGMTTEEHIHALGDIASGHDADEEWGAPGTTLCGIPADWLSIPGLFSRMGAERCPKCCLLTGIPQGLGSPKNMTASHG